MDQEMAAAVGIGILVGVLFAVVVAVLIGGLFLRWSVRILQGFSPGYGRSVLVVLVTMIAGFVASVVLVGVLVAAGMYDPSAIMLGAEPDPQALAAMMGAQAALSIGNLVFGLLLTALFVNLMIRMPDGSAIGFGRSLLVALLYLLMMMALMFVAVIIIAVLAGIFAGMAAAG